MRHTCQRRIFFNTLAKALFLAILGALPYAHTFNDLYTGTVTLEDKELGTNSPSKSLGDTRRRAAKTT